MYFNEFKSSHVRRLALVYSATISASPTETSAAATVMMKNTRIWPFRLPLKWDMATRARFAALSINSRHM